MSKRLYPPNIGGTIPAFCGTILTVPFSMNKAVGKGEIGGFALKIKTVNGEFKGFVKATSSDAGFAKTTLNFDLNNDFEVKFDVSGIDFTIGQYYKVQLAYIYSDGETIGYYSTVGVAKYTTQPKISIDNLSFGHINTHNYFYTGVYSQLGGDTTEKIYSSRFQVFNKDGIVIEDTGFVLHNSTEDDLVYEQHESFQLAQDLPIDESFYIQFSVITTNNLQVKTSKYRIMQRRSIAPEIEATLNASCDVNNGFVKLAIIDEKDDVISGKFLISRASDKNGWAWEEFRRFDLHSMVPEDWSLLDCTVEQGVLYRYSLQQYNDYDIYSDRIVSNDVYVDFEDAFLYDGEKQLKIKFNPQISSFSKTILESKIDTIGSKYPFISRNGNVSYKEMPISGLISYHMDDINLFMPKEELGLEVGSTNLTSKNITAERIFKMAVLDWLTNGKPKIFRSPTEGNFIVYLMNINFTPEGNLGRMLHNFSCNAYEIGEFNIPNLEHYGLIDSSENLKTQTQWSTIQMMDLGVKYIPIDSSISEKEDIYYLNERTGQYILESAAASPDKQYYEKDISEKLTSNFIQINNSEVYSVNFSDMMPGSKIKIGDEIVEIGATGAYYFKSDVPINYVGVQANTSYQGICTTSYQTKDVNIFNNIQHVEIVDTPIKQFIGEYYKLEEFPYFNPNVKEKFTSDNLIDIIQDSKNELLKLNFARFIKRPSYDIYANIPKNGVFNPSKTYDYYDDMDCSSSKKRIRGYDELLIYPIRKRRDDYREQIESGTLPYPNEGHYIEAMAGYYAPYTGYAIDGYSKQIIEMTPDMYRFKIDDAEIDIKETEKYLLKDTSNVKYIEGGLGVISELSYCRQFKTYAFENTDYYVSQLKKHYEDILEQYYAERLAGGPHTVSLAQVKEAYDIFLINLNKVIIKYKEDNGIEI